MGKITSVCVEYKNVDSWHVFTCQDLPGLYVASANREIAYNDVGPSIEALLRLDFGIECQAFPEKPFADFVRKTENDTVEAPIALTSRRYAVACNR